MVHELRIVHSDLKARGGHAGGGPGPGEGAGPGQGAIGSAPGARPGRQQEEGGPQGGSAARSPTQMHTPSPLPPPTSPPPQPANYLLVEGQLKLIDFGIAKAIGGDTTSISRESQARARAPSPRPPRNPFLRLVFEERRGRTPSAHPKKEAPWAALAPIPPAFLQFPLPPCCQVGTLNYMSPEAILGGANNILGAAPMKARGT